MSYTQTLQETRKQKLTKWYEEKVNQSYFTVSKVSTGTGFAIVNRDNGAKLSDVSKRYTLVRNIDIFEPFIRQFGHEAIRKFYGYGQGKYFYMEIETGRKFNFGTEEKPDMVNEVLCIANSYNKTKSFSFRLGAFRWVCSNGLHSGEALVNYKKIHVGEIPVQKLVFEALLKFQDNTFETWKRLKEVPLTLEKRLAIVSELKVFEEENSKGEPLENNIRLNRYIRSSARGRLERNSNSVDNQENGWGLYNQINSAIERNISGKSQIDKRITANKRMEEFLVARVLEKDYSVASFLN